MVNQSRSAHCFILWTHLSFAEIVGIPLDKERTLYSCMLPLAAHYIIQCLGARGLHIIHLCKTSSTLIECSVEVQDSLI